MKKQHTTMKMMRPLLLLACCLVPTAQASPAIVWSKSASHESPQKSAVVNSQSVAATRVLSDMLLTSTLDAASKRSVVVLLGRNSDDGSEAMSLLAASGALPGVASKYDAAAVHHTHVVGMDAATTLLRQAKFHKQTAVKLTLTEFETYLNTAPAVDTDTAAEETSQRARALSNADVWIVQVDASADPVQIDAAVVAAIEHASFDHVMLAAQRSVDEVMLEREILTRWRLESMQSSAASQANARRRLANGDDANANAAGDDANANQNMSGVYYVSMTPNIFAGILFTFMFAFVTSVAVSCMGQIQGQDVFVSKMPSVGREA
jgi:hypothetical protein